MKITIECDDNILELSDENLVHDNFVDLYIVETDKDQSPNFHINACVSVDELLVAVQAFCEKRANRLERESLMRGVEKSDQI